MATQPVDAQNQVIHFVAHNHGCGHFKIGQRKSEFHFPEQGYLVPLAAYNFCVVGLSSSFGMTLRLTTDVSHPVSNSP